MSSVPCWPAGCPVSCTRMHAPAHALGSCGCSVLLSLVLRVHSRSRSREGKAQGILSDCKVTAAWAAAHVTWCTWGEWSEWGTTNGTAPLTHSRTLWHPSACGRTQRSSSKRAASGRPVRGHPPNRWFDHLLVPVHVAFLGMVSAVVPTTSFVPTAPMRPDNDPSLIMNQAKCQWSNNRTLT